MAVRMQKRFVNFDLNIINRTPCTCHDKASVKQITFKIFRQK